MDLKIKASDVTGKYCGNLKSEKGCPHLNRISWDRFRCFIFQREENLVMDGKWPMRCEKCLDCEAKDKELKK